MDSETHYVYIVMVYSPSTPNLYFLPHMLSNVPPSDMNNTELHILHKPGISQGRRQNSGCLQLG